MTMLCKIHPYTPSQGYFRKRHICPPYTFRVERGWYEVDDTIAEKLRGEFNNPGDPTSRPVFIIASKAEAGAMDKAEQEIAAKADAPQPLPKEISKKLEGEFDDVFDGDEDLSPPEEDEPEPEPKPSRAVKRARKKATATRRKKT